MKSIHFLAIFKVLVIIILTLTFFSSCKKDCFNQTLYNAHKNQACTLDCPGVKGCDGKTYCNECMANSQGIAVQP